MRNNIKLYSNVVTKGHGQSEIEIEGEIKSDLMSPYRKRAVKKLGENIKVSGFRKGHIPEKILIDKIGEQAILEEAAGMALADAYPQIIEDNNLKVLGSPRVSITKLAPNNPVGFKILTAVEPDIELPDYGKIAKEIVKNHSNEKIEVTEKEVSDAIDQIRKNFSTEKKDKKDLSAEAPPAVVPADRQGRAGSVRAEISELNDAFVKKLGNFKNVEDFKEKLKENIGREKKMREKEKKRVAIMDKIIHDSSIILPNILVESELEKMLAQFKDDIARTKLSLKEYLAKIKKTEDDLQRQWRADAEKRAKLQLILNKIAQKENIVVPKEDIEREVKHLLGHYSNANPKNVELYITTVLTNEKVFQFLENQK